MNYSVENIVISFEAEEVEELICVLDYVMSKTNEFNVEESLNKFKQSLNSTQTPWYETVKEELYADQS